MGNNKTAIICNCAQITLQEILDAITAGATSVALLQETTAATTGCGRCMPQLKRILKNRESSDSSK